MRRLLLLLAVACLALPIAVAQDPVKVDPKHYKVQLENDQVRALSIKVGPHEKTPMHEHPASVTVWLTEGHGKLTTPDGKVQDFHAKAGSVEWEGAVKHAGENTGDKPFELIQIELKAKPAAKAAAKPEAKK